MPDRSRNRLGRQYGDRVRGALPLERWANMAVDKRGRKLPKGIQQRYDTFEGRFQYQGKRYLVHGDTVMETQKAMNELRYKLEHGAFVEKKKVVFSEWFITWMEQYKKNRVKAGTYYRQK